MDSSVVQIEWLRSMLCELGYEQHTPTTLYQDNQSAIHIINSGTYTPRTKHYSMRYHYIAQAMEQALIILRYLPSAEHPADLLTKKIASIKQFYKLRAKLLCCANTPSGLPNL